MMTHPSYIDLNNQISRATLQVITPIIQNKDQKRQSSIG